ncbi:MAG: addiction module protein [bacterium]
MSISDFPEIAELSIPEKILLVEDIWDSISLDESNIPIPTSHKEELDKRLKSYKANPGDILSLEELKARVERRK